MSKFKQFVVIAGLFAITTFAFQQYTQPVEARSGCCSSHDGVCGCGCCDGTPLSDTCSPYYPECNSSSSDYSDYSEPEADPSEDCPSHSTYSYTSEECLCDDGYTFSLSGVACVEIPEHAHAANNDTDVWICDDGYEEVGNECVFIEIEEEEEVVTPEVIDTTDEEVDSADDTNDYDNGDSLSGETEDSSVFLDVDTSNPNEEAISYLYGQGIIGGYTDGTFKPDNSLNRAELLKILVEGQGITPDSTVYNNCFSDVTDDWYAPYVCYAKEQGWVDGYEDGAFQPAKNVNRVEAIKMLINSQGLGDQLESVVDEDLFEDVDKTAWYASYLKLAKDLGILEEENGNYNPSGDMKRGSICENLYRLLIELKANE